MMISDIDFKSLFPGRSIGDEWSSRPGRNHLPSLSEVEPLVPIDVGKILEFYNTMNLTPSTEYESKFVSGLPGITKKYTDSYYRGVLTEPTDKAKGLQNVVDKCRGMKWWEHNQNLSKSKLIKSLKCLNNDYNPIVDERNHTKLKREVRGSYMEEVIKKAFKGRITRVRFGLLGPGEGVSPHIDVTPNYACRIHIPLKTNSMSYSFFKKRENLEVFQMELGKAYLLNGGILHWAQNFGQSDRLHLVMSVDGVEDWIRN